MKLSGMWPRRRVDPLADRHHDLVCLVAECLDALPEEGQVIVDPCPARCRPAASRPESRTENHPHLAGAAPAVNGLMLESSRAASGSNIAEV
jgi:hypothetical protein